MPVKPKTRVTSKPPQSFVETCAKPKPPARRKYAIIGKISVKYKKYYLSGNFSINKGATAMTNKE